MNPLVKRHHPVLRLITSLLVPVQLWATVPAWALQMAPGVADTSIARLETCSSAPRLSRGIRASAPQTERPDDLQLLPVVAPAAAQRITTERWLEERLVPIGGASDAVEDVALLETLEQFRQRVDLRDWSVLTDFVAARPSSVWRPALLVNLGLLYRRDGSFARALTAWEAAWALGRNEPGGDASWLMDRVAAELARMYAALGRQPELANLLQQLEGREIPGPLLEQIAAAREGLWRMQQQPDVAFRCGPLALARVLETARPGQPVDARVYEARSTSAGTSLVEVQRLAQQAGRDYQMAKRQPGAAVITPAVMHWKLDHFAALLDQRGPECLVQDPTFDSGDNDQLWLSRSVLDAEASGYFLVPAGPLPEGWQPVAEREALLVWGKGNTSGYDSSRWRCSDHKVGGTQCDGVCPGMARYAIHTMLVSLNMTDTPVGYVPPRGPAMYFTVNYNQRASDPTGTPGHSNLGPLWIHNWFAYVEDNPTTLAVDKVVLRGGGTETYAGFGGGSAGTNMETRVVLVRTSSSPIQYERRLPDGSKEIFAASDGASTPPRRIFLTEVIDPATNRVQLTYDSVGGVRLRSVIDALGRTNSLAYNLAGDALKITGVTDPFGRSAAFQYALTGGLTQMVAVVDTIGLTSQFAYASSSFIEQLTTPYGTHSFTNGTAIDATTNVTRWVEITDPLGAEERVEAIQGIAGIGDGEPIPTGLVPGVTNLYLNGRNTFFWDKKAMREAPGDYASARIYHWLHNETVSAGLLESEKQPLENRVWYTYPGQTNHRFTTTNMLGRAAYVGRVLDDNTTQLYRFGYNTLGAITNAIDPAGRETKYVYDANGVDLLEVRQITSPGNDVLLARFTYNAQHLPLTAVDASAQTNRFVYNAVGQLTGITNALNEATTLVYSNSYLIAITGAVANAVTKFTYDATNRVRTVTDSENYTLSFDYDNLDRVTKVTYPDATFEQINYDRLDPTETRDRLGRWTSLFYDPLQRVSAVQDALGRITNFQWCDCGSLEAIHDALGQITIFHRDLEGRVLSKEYDDGSRVQYQYETATSRLNRVTDPKGQETHYAYFGDNNLQAVSYSNAVVATPGVSFTYDPVFNRLSQMIDGTGTNSYSYNAIPGTTGAGRLGSIDGALANDTLTFAYDKLGRVTARAINAVTNAVSYDALGRVNTVTNALGGFGYTYTNATARLSSISAPNGQSITFGYFNNADDQRLQEIKHLKSGGATLSKFNYTYDVTGQIRTWTQQVTNATPNVFTFGYDKVNQLTSAIFESQSSILKRFVYGYDKAGNRIAESLESPGSLLQTTYAANNLNQLVSRSVGGPLRFSGSVNETSTVIVASQPASLVATNTAGTNIFFTGSASAATGTNVVQVIAQDYSHNATTNNYRVVVSNTVARTLTYDVNGNLTSATSATNATLTLRYDWDAADRLVGFWWVSGSTTNRSEFTYDGLGRRVKIVEKTGTTTNSVKRFAWAGAELAERDSGGGTVTKRFFAQGEMQGSTNLFYTRDHLGSIREVVDSAGTNIVARYDYDPYGRRTKVGGTGEADFGFTGHYYHGRSGLHLALYRAYDAELGRWLSQDPIGAAGGLNLYQYALSDPVNLLDPSGRSPVIALAAVVVLVGAALVFSSDTAVAPEPGDTNYYPSHGTGDMIANIGGGVVGGAALGRVFGAAGRLLGRLNPFRRVPVKLFRAVSQNELDDVLTSGFRANPTCPGMETKLFATSADDAAKFGKDVLFPLDKNPITIVQVEVPASVASRLWTGPTDFGLPTVGVYPEVLPAFNASMELSVLSSTPIPGL